MIKQGTDPVVTTLCLSKYNNLGINYCMHVRMYVNLKLNVVTQGFYPQSYRSKPRIFFTYLLFDDKDEGRAASGWLRPITKFI